MKLSASQSVFLATLFATFSSGSPITRRETTMQMNTPTGQSVGAAYFITNEETGNFVVSADIESDGTLNLRQAIATGGLGLHGNNGGVTDGPDGLFSQGAVKVSAAANVLATVNPGSNTLSIFSIDPSDPINLNRIGDPVGSGGEFPMSLAFNKVGDTLCALNGGQVNGVSCFKVDQTKGLINLSGTNRALNLNQTTPATGPAGSASHIIFSEDNTQLIASVKGVPPTPGFLAVWDVATDGSLSPVFKTVTPSQGGLLPFSMTVIEGKNALLATDAGVGFDIFDLSTSGGNASSVVPIDGQSATCWSSFSSQTGNFYLTDIGTSMVTEVNVDDTLKGSIVKQYAQDSNSGTIDNDIASVGGKDFMYILAANATAIDVLSLNAPGQAQNIQKVDIAGPAKASGLIVGASVQGMTTFIKE
ncbi:hypothetical protein EV368DRAFT_80034 [Lentinula lateritia]|uniref:Uncharacterized protein n=1 Tax=Lentinula aff. lateritia TaxID=2804960 RepID=A0ACC1UFM7_9AGAR|nr:hypothetical protein F5876DRAFT_85677 [Lentinula aff. lateritia]KAJ3855033.1 hypothetical protein EV368DRAFT_80034 [Lentinula lateritia]